MANLQRRYAIKLNRTANLSYADLRIKYLIKMNMAVNSSSADRFRLGLDLAAHNPQACLREVPRSRISASDDIYCLVSIL